MSKWFGVIGYAETVETEPGVWEPQIIEHSYYGDVYRNTRGLQNSNSINDNITVSNEISIVADPYAKHHIYDMRYIEFMGAKWRITNVSEQYPRLILSLGGLYNV